MHIHTVYACTHHTEHARTHAHPGYAHTYYICVHTRWLSPAANSPSLPSRGEAGCARLHRAARAGPGWCPALPGAGRRWGHVAVAPCRLRPGLLGPKAMGPEPGTCSREPAPMQHSPQGPCTHPLPHANPSSGCCSCVGQSQGSRQQELGKELASGPRSWEVPSLVCLPLQATAQPRGIPGCPRHGA